MERYFSPHPFKFQITKKLRRTNDNVTRVHRLSLVLQSHNIMTEADILNDQSAALLNSVDIFGYGSADCSNAGNCYNSLMEILSTR